MGLAKREFLAKTLVRTGALRTLRSLQRRFRPRTLPVLAYHRIADDPGPYFRGVVDATPRSFRDQMNLVRRNCSNIGIEDIARACAGEAVPRLPLMISFDDAYRSCLDTVLPVLREFGLRATFFVATRAISERRLFWWDAIAYLVHKAEPSLLHVDIEIPQQRRIIIGPDDGQREATINELARIVECTPGVDPDDFVTALAASLGLAWTREIERERADEVLMTWDDLRVLRDEGHAIESHTRTHRVLQTLQAEELHDELVGAREELRTQLDVESDAIAYPCGYPVEQGGALRRAVASAGYRLGFTYGGGVNRVDTIDAFEIRRLAVSATIDPAFFEAMLSVPAIAHRSERSIAFGV